MDQSKIGAFLKELRKEHKLTQEKLADMLYVSARTISRWETGTSMPDISMLVDIADFYEVSIPEIIAGERKCEHMNDEIKATASAMAEYSKHNVKREKKKIVGILLILFGLFITGATLAILPAGRGKSLWYIGLSCIFILIGIYLLASSLIVKKGLSLLTVAAVAVLLFGFFNITDYIAVTQFNQLPRFCLERSYTTEKPHQVTHKTLFYTVIQENPDTAAEKIYIAR